MTAPETAARLKIAGELMDIVRTEDLLTIELLSSAALMLKSSYALIKKVIAKIPPVPNNPDDLFAWLVEAGEVSAPPVPRKKSRKRKVVTQELFLFEEVSP